jgi:hypothetical protein
LASFALIPFSTFSLFQMVSENSRVVAPTVIFHDRWYSKVKVGKAVLKKPPIRDHLAEK